MALFARRVVSLSILIIVFASPVQAAMLQCQVLPQLFEVYLKNHYVHHTLTDVIKAHTVEQFIKSIDPSKTMLLESDVAKLRKDLPSMFSSMQTGNCSVLTDSEKLLISRAKENEEFVKGVLNKDYKLDENVEIILDPRKRGYAKTAEEKQATLRKMIHFQVSNYLLSDMKLPDAKKQLTHRYELATKRLSEEKPDDWMANYAEAFALALDPHSSFLSPDSLEDFNIQMHLSLEGIGASLSSQDGFTVIEELIPGGRAEASHQLLPKDKIISVAQDKDKPVSVIDMDLREVVKLIRGKKGTKVRLTVLRQGKTTKTFTVTLVRDKIDIKEQAAKITYETRKVGTRSLKIGIIDLPSFYGGGGEGTRSSSNDVKGLLVQANKEKVDGIVLNLSRNGGGLLEEAVKISGLFINRGNIVATKSSEGNVQFLADEDANLVYPGPLEVLTSRLSASASEILAGALRDYRRAVIVGGDHTFGKGTVQALSSLPLDLGGMKVTTGMFFIPGGESTQHKGVASDVQVPSVFNTEDIGENTLDYSLPPQAIPPFTSKEANSLEPGKHWAPVDMPLVKMLQEKSKERVSKSAKFAEIRKEIEEAVKNGSVVKLADLRKKSETEKKKNGKTGKEKEKVKVKELDEPIIQEGVSIMTDIIASRK